MANRYAIATGNWSNTAIWDGGTLPTSADDVRPNGFIVTIDQNISVLSLRNDASAPAAANGSFVLTGNFTVTITNLIQCFATSLLTYNGTGTAYITGANSTSAIISSTTTDTTNTVVHNGTGTLIVDMVINSAVTGETNRSNIAVTNGGTLTLLKDIRKGASAAGSTNSQAILISGVNGSTINTKNIFAGTNLLNGITANVNTTINVVGDIKGGAGAATFNASNSILIGASSTSTINVTGNVYSHSANATGLSYGIQNAGTCTINVTGNVYGATITSQSFFPNAIYSFGLMTLIINGNVFGGTTSGGNAQAIVMTNGVGSITVIGNVSGGGLNGNGIVTSCLTSVTGIVTGGTNTGSVAITSTGNLTVTGSITGGASNAIICSGTTTNLNGTITGGTANGVLGVLVNGNTLNHIGSAQASAFASAIGCNAPTTSTVICTGPFLRSTNIVAIASQTLRINAAYNPYFEFRKSDGTNVTYVDQATANFPAVGNVRFGTSYASGLYTGTLRVPTASQVLAGIPVDATTGTLLMTPADFWNYLIASGFTTGSIGERLQNSSTVATTGAQIAAYNI